MLYLFKQGNAARIGEKLLLKSKGKENFGLHKTVSWQKAYCDPIAPQRKVYRTKGDVFLTFQGRIRHSQCLEKTMLELLKSLVFAVIMVPVVMAIILGAIYGLGEVFNLFSNIGHKDQPKKQH
ncbi:Multidrug efflux pump accessory protein AcrZ [compost metagenome]